MGNLKSKRIQRWGFAGAWAGLIYATLYIARPICDFLQKYPWFSMAINASIVFSVVLIMAVIFRANPHYKASAYFLFLLVFAGYGWGMVWLRLPAERLHLIEYGVLAFLIYRALILDLKKPWAYGGAFILTSLIGWGDEGIQYLLPNRYYEFRDVCLNSASAALGLFFTFADSQRKKTGPGSS